jgi:regulator of cell morphogenesis and NO signaling
MESRSNVTLAELAAHQPGAAAIFLRSGLDFCCRGRRPLAEACAEKGLDPAAILAAVEEAAGQESSISDWTARPTAEIVEQILQHYHLRLRKQLPALLEMAARVERVHAEKATVPAGLAAHLARLTEATLSHLEKEETVVFPQILAGHASECGGPVQSLEREHEEHGLALAKTRRLTGDLVLPAEACTTWQALYLGLRELEQELMEHIHLENNVLFPRVLCN